MRAGVLHSTSKIIEHFGNRLHMSHADRSVRGVSHASRPWAFCRITHKGHAAVANGACEGGALIWPLYNENDQTKAAGHWSLT